MRFLAIPLWLALATLASTLATPLVRAAPPVHSIQYGSGGGNVSVFHVETQPSGVPASGAKTLPGGAPSAAVPAPVPAPVGGEDDTVAELTRLRAEQQKAWETINGNNPMSASFGLGTPGASAGTGPFEQINKILSQPAVQGYLRFFTNPIFSKGVDQVMNSPNRMTLLYVELGLIVFMLIFRAWRYSKSTHWAARLWTRIWTLLLFWSCAVIVVPWAVLGDPYYQTIRGALDVLLSSKK